MTDGSGSDSSGSWQPDPTSRYRLRWQQGTGEWTDHVYSSEGELGNDPYSRPPTPQSPPTAAKRLDLGGSEPSNAAQKRPRRRRRKLLIVLGIVISSIIVLSIIGSLASNSETASTEQSSATTAARITTTTTLAVKDVFEDCMDPWDGNYNALEDLIRPLLNDPSSMETFGTYYSTLDDLSDGLVTVRLDYGARNAFGGMVRASAWAEMRPDCTVAEVTDYGF